jgi:UDP-N-acetylmuramate--alanine ligase
MKIPVIRGLKCCRNHTYELFDRHLRYPWQDHHDVHGRHGLGSRWLEPHHHSGGKVKNFGSNNVMGSGKYIVVEADEYDHSFLSLTPCIAGITNVDEDHLDCYRNLDDIKGAFIEYANKVPFFGSVIACLDDPGVQAILPHINKKIVTYGLSGRLMCKL